MRFTPKIILKTVSNTSTDWTELVNTTIGDCIGVVKFSFSLDPDPNAEYFLTIGKLVENQIFQLSSLMTIDLPFIWYIKGYDGLPPRSPIILKVRNLSANITTKTSYIFNWIEVWR